MSPETGIADSLTQCWGAGGCWPWFLLTLVYPHVDPVTFISLLSSGVWASLSTLKVSVFRERCDTITQKAGSRSFSF